MPGLTTQVIFNLNGNAAASPALTFNSVANLFTVLGNVTVAGAVNTGTMSASGNIVGQNILGNGAGLSSLTGANVTGTVGSATTAATVTDAAQPNITSVGTLTSLSASGNITGNYFLGNGSQLTGLPATYSIPKPINQLI